MAKKIRSKVWEDLVTYPDCYDELADILIGSELPFELGSFDDFVQNIFAKSYPNYDFNTWHVRYLSGKVDEVLQRDEPMLLVVLPRYHLKSTVIGYASTIYRMLQSFGDGMYVSFKDELSSYHLSNIKTAIASNPELSRTMKDQHRKSEALVSYEVGSKRLRVFGSGIFGVKRGIHTDTIVIADDLLGDLQNPMTFTELEKAKRIFKSEVMNIPNKKCPLFVFGTVIDYSDLLFDLKDNPQFVSVWMPAIDPNPSHKVLWEKMYPKDWLDRRKEATGWKAFSTEFLLTPVLATQAFFTWEDMNRVADKTLKNYSIFESFDKQDKHVVAGFDVGKRRNPSHLSVFVDDENDNLVMIHQSFWDEMEYEEQVGRINAAIENFKIDKLYWDATRGELEERGLPTRQCVPIKFTGKGERSQSSFALDFAKRVEKSTIRIIDDDRFVSQITSVTNDLKAPSTPLGHADSFWSVALAIGAYQDFYARDRKRGFADLGDAQQLTIEKSVKRGVENRCVICKGRMFELLEGKKRCLTCFTTYEIENGGKHGYNKFGNKNLS